MTRDSGSGATPPRKKTGLWARLNRALTEVGTEHFADDRDWDARVKLPEWQLARLKQRHAERVRQRRGAGVDAGVDTGENNEKHP